MRVRRTRGWEIPEREATPEAVFLNRRQVIAAGAGVLWGTLVPGGAALAETDLTSDLYPAPRNGRYAIERPVTPEQVNTGHNSFLEFGAQKNIARAAQALETRPWDIRIEGLVEKEFTIAFETLIRRMQLEERLYRHRAVEGWSMTVPWTGFPLAALVSLARPQTSARFLRMESFMDPSIASGQRQYWYPWPYVEGLTLAEATNDLAFLVTGAYGRPVGKVMGAPLRLHVPWKYGFKSIKSIVRFTFTDEQPETFWQTVLPKEYGFWANVNPDSPHPRWNQAEERDLATGAMLPTRLYNGYGEFVAGLYGGMDADALYF
ncbi:MAG: protein-methionine-sulfoxide reductase catalytic subunit MsrP [Bauldia sp.]